MQALAKAIRRSGDKRAPDEAAEPDGGEGEDAPQPRAARASTAAPQVVVVVQTDKATGEVRVVEVASSRDGVAVPFVVRSKEQRDGAHLPNNKAVLEFAPKRVSVEAKKALHKLRKHYIAVLPWNNLSASALQYPTGAVYVMDQSEVPSHSFFPMERAYASGFAMVEVEPVIDRALGLTLTSDWLSQKTVTETMLRLRLTLRGDNEPQHLPGLVLHDTAEHLKKHSSPNYPGDPLLNTWKVDYVKAHAHQLLLQPEDVWALKGKLAGRIAAAAERAGRDFCATCPPDAVGAGAEAELSWLAAFDAAFEAAAPAPAPADRVVAGLAPPKRRRVSAAKPEANKKGRAGLDESAGSAVSSAVYAWVRTRFYLPADHGRDYVRSSLADDGFDFSAAEESAWWEQKGHRLVLAKAKTARSALVDTVKAGWLAHGASSLTAAIPTLPEARPAVATGAPPTQIVEGTGARIKIEYDMTQPTGAAAANLVTGWLGATTEDMQAPWRQTAGGGGSEFGKARWHAALKAAYKPQSSPPVYKLWQLALADHVVRHGCEQRAVDTFLTATRVLPPFPGRLPSWCSRRTSGRCARQPQPVRRRPPRASGPTRREASRHGKLGWRRS